jgi:acid stress chaperone HdeB
MRRSMLLTAISMIALPTLADAQATVTIDVAKISCDQFVGFKITDPRYIAIWLSGYYNGKRNNTVIDTQAFNEGYEKLRNYCVVNPTRTVMQAVETLFGQ